MVKVDLRRADQNFQEAVTPEPTFPPRRNENLIDGSTVLDAVYLKLFELVWHKVRKLISETELLAEGGVMRRESPEANSHVIFEVPLISTES
jgi:hypothetical protein